jgi:hypothetical protein
MKIRYYKLLSIMVLVIFLIVGCNSGNQAVSASASSTFHDADMEYFSEKEGALVAPDGTVYVFLGIEGSVGLLGNKKLIGKIEGEDDSEPYGFDIGLYACEQDTDRDMLLRYLPQNEWGSYYRKRTAPSLDISYMNCTRLEFVADMEMSQQNMYTAGAEHFSCGNGIVGMDSVVDFFQNVKSGKTANEAGLYTGNRIGTAYGFFTGENAAVVCFPVDSYNDKAYTIMIDNVVYVLPYDYLAQLGFRN